MTLSAADRLALSDLVHRYAGYVDGQRFDDVAELFTATAEFVVPDPPGELGPTVCWTGVDGVRDAMRGLTGVIRTQHGIVGEFYDSGSNGAAAGSVAAVAHHWSERDGQLTDLVWYLRYTDRYRRTGAGWRIARRALTIDAIETRPAARVRR